MIPNSQDVASGEDGIASLFSFRFFASIYEVNLSRPQDHQHQPEKTNQHFSERSASRHVPALFQVAGPRQKLSRHRSDLANDNGRMILISVEANSRPYILPKFKFHKFWLWDLGRAEGASFPEI